MIMIIIVIILNHLHCFDNSDNKGIWLSEHNFNLHCYITHIHTNPPLFLTFNVLYHAPVLLTTHFILLCITVVVCMF